MQKERQILSFSLGFDVLFYFKLFYFWLFYFRLCAIEVPYKTADGRVLASTDRLQSNYRRFFIQTSIPGIFETHHGSERGFLRGI